MLRRVFSRFRSLRAGQENRRKPMFERFGVKQAQALAAERLEPRRYLAGDPIVSVATNFGNFQIELLPSAAPQTVANFLSYVSSGAYTNTIFHRSQQPSASNPGDLGIIQTGGFTSASTTYTGVSQFQTIPTNSPIPLEYNLPNTAGTVAMARQNSPNTATDQFFINDVDNTTTLGAKNGGGYAVFGKILGNGMQVVNQIAALSTIQADPTNQFSAFNQLPLGPNNQLVQITSITLDSIDGTVFSDANGNGQQDSGEAGIAGRTVFVDVNGDGKPNSGEPTATTDDNGNYAFTGLAAGSYTVRELLPTGKSLTTGAQNVTVAAASTAAGVNFGEAPPSITGTVFLDDNGDGQLDSGEQGIAGRTVFIDTNGDGQPNSGEPTTTTDANGNYSFDSLAAGDYTVREVAPADVTQTLASQTVTVAANRTTAGVNLGERPEITGTVFNDLNVNGKLDVGEPGLAGVTIFLDVDGSGALGSNPSTVTDAQGNYAFEGLAAGSYAVREVVTPDHGTTITTPAANATVAGGQTVTANIGNALTSTLAPLPVSVDASTPSSDPDTAFINGVYFRLLGHDADAAGLSYWQQQLAGGATRDAVAQGVWNSAEHRGLVVEQFYHTFLGRASDPVGKSFWVDAFDTWGAEKVEVAGFVTSAEYQNLHAANADFVDALYRDIALRPADAAGAAYWTNALQNGESRLDVALAFVNGQEASTRVVDAFYADFLHRAADAASQQAFVSDLQQNMMSVKDIGVNILASDEFFKGAALPSST